MECISHGVKPLSGNNYKNNTKTVSYACKIRIFAIFFTDIKAGFRGYLTFERLFSATGAVRVRLAYPKQLQLTFS